MRWTDYLAGKTLSLCFLAIEAVFLFLISMILDVGAGAVAAIEGILFIITFVWLAVGYSSQRRRFMQLSSSISKLDQKYIMGEIIAEPKNEMEHFYYEIMKTISRSAIDEVEREKEQREEYQTYVESWIHEIKTPLTACSLILDNGGDITKLRREIKQADNLTENILYYSRVNQPGQDLLIRPFHIEEVVNECIKDEMPLLIAARISIDMKGDFIIDSDEKAVAFIIKQLLCNSAKYSPGCRIQISADKGILTVTDNGIGIPSYDLPRITEKGFTGSNGRRVGNSTGMGLYLVKSVCDHLQIGFAAESEVNEYTRFILNVSSLTGM